MSMNPFDEIAVEEAIRLKEKGVATEIVAVSIGPAKAQETLRTASPWATARSTSPRTRSRAAGRRQAARQDRRRGTAQMIILGKQAIDDDNNATAELAACSAGRRARSHRRSIRRGRRQRTREVDGGLETTS